VSDRDSATADRKVTFSEIFAVGEYRALFLASQLSWIGDYMARAAVMVLVFVETGSVALAAAAFAISYAPWVLGGPFLTALAERLRYRTVMVVCDVCRAVLIGLVALPGMPLPAMLVLIFGVAMLAPPALAARSATMPLVLTGERVVLGIAVNQAGGQATQVGGYMVGAIVAAFNPRIALLINAATFTLSAFIIRTGLRQRPPAMRAEQRTTLLRETGEGFRMVFGTPPLRAIAIIVFASMLFAILPEGLAIGWADELAAGAEARRGLYQGLIMVANPLGVVLGGVLISRLLAPSARRRLVPLFAVAAPLSLVPALAEPGLAGVVAMATVCGFVMAGMTPTLNGLFVQILRHGYRARAFGVMNSGMQVIQGLAVLGAGLLTELLPLHQVVGLWSLCGVVLMSVLAMRWPKLEFFNHAIAETDRANRATEEQAAREATGRESTAGAEAPTPQHVGADVPAQGGARHPEDPRRRRAAPPAGRHRLAP
jgi:MFS family permease